MFLMVFLVAAMPASACLCRSTAFCAQSRNALLTFGKFSKARAAARPACSGVKEGSFCLASWMPDSMIFSQIVTPISDCNKSIPLRSGGGIVAVVEIGIEIKMGESD